MNPSRSESGPAARTSNVFRGLRLALALLVASSALVPPAAADEHLPDLPAVVHGDLFGIQLFKEAHWFVRVDHSTGAVTPLAAIPGLEWVAPASDTFDNVLQRYFFLGWQTDERNQRLYTIDAASGAVLHSVPVSWAVSNIEYDPVGDVLYATSLSYAYGGEGVEFVSIDYASGDTTVVLRFDTTKYFGEGSNAFDVASGLYYVMGWTPLGTTLFTVDARGGSVLNRVAVKAYDLMEFDPIEETLVAISWAADSAEAVRVDAASGALTPIAKLDWMYWSHTGSGAFDPLGERYFFGGGGRVGNLLVTLHAGSGDQLDAVSAPPVQNLEYGFSIVGADPVDTVCKDLPRIVQTVRIPVADLVGLLGQTIPVPDEVRRIVTQVGFRCEPVTGGSGGGGSPCGDVIVDEEFGRVAVTVAHSVDPAGIVRVYWCVWADSGALEYTYVQTAGRADYFYEQKCTVPVLVRAFTGDEWLVSERFTADC